MELEQDMHSTNYTNTLICPADDCEVVAKIPEKPGSVAALQYRLLIDNAYALTSDDVLCAVAAKRKGLDCTDMDQFRAAFFSKGQPCFRASPLTKTHGWAVHSDENGYVALLSPVEPRFTELCRNTQVLKVKALRNKRK